MSCFETYTGKAINRETGETIDIPYVGQAGVNAHMSAWQHEDNPLPVYGEDPGEIGVYGIVATGGWHSYWDGEKWTDTHSHTELDFICKSLREDSTKGLNRDGRMSRRNAQTDEMREELGKDN